MSNVFDINSGTELDYALQKGVPTVTFSDINLGAGTVSPFEIVSDLDSINQNIMLIAATPKRSKILRPELGSNIMDHLFEPIDDVTANAIRVDLIQALEQNFEYRLQLRHMEVLPDLQNQSYYVDMEYIVPDLSNQVADFQFILHRKAA